MKKPEPRPEYDFRGGTRGRHVRTSSPGNLRSLDPDLVEKFPDSASVNDALRQVGQVPTTRPKKPAPG